VDRAKFTGKLPASIDGQRVRAVLMDRLHVTRSHGTPAHRNGCSSERTWGAGTEPDFSGDFQLPE